MIRWLRRNRSGEISPRARCPKCGHDLKPFWKKDELVQVIGTQTGEHKILYATCQCGWAGRVNNPKVLPDTITR